MVVSSRPIPDIEQLLKEEYEDDEVNVKIVELSSDTLQKKDLVIGENKPKLKVNTEIKKKETAELIPGMGFEEEENAEDSGEEVDENLKSKKDIKKMLKKQATKKVQKSKVFQMKSKLDRVKNKKKSAQMNRHNKKNKVDPRKDKSKKRIGKRKH